MTQPQQVQLSGGDVSPDATVEALVGQVPPGFQIVWRRNGRPLFVPSEDYADTLHELGLLSIRYDVADAENELLQHLAALDATIHSAVTEASAAGYIDATLETVVATAVFELRDACVFWMQAMGARLQTEAVIADIAAHKAEHGDLSRVPGLQKHEDLADAYLAAKPEAVEAARMAAQAETTPEVQG